MTEDRKESFILDFLINTDDYDNGYLHCKLKEFLEYLECEGEIR